MKNFTLQLIGVLLFLIGSAGVSMACTCMHLRGDPDKAYTSASAVFSGNVLEITAGEPSPLLAELKTLTAKFRVTKSWKLVRTDEVFVSTVSINTLCGFSFKVGESYLVYAHGGGNQFVTDICTRTVQMPGTKEDLEYLKRKRLLKVKPSR